MARPRVSKRVLRKAAKIVKEGRKGPTPAVPSFPIIQMGYPSHGTGKLKERLVKVTDMKDNCIIGFEIKHIGQEEHGKYRTYLRRKVFGPIRLITITR